MTPTTLAPAPTWPTWPTWQTSRATLPRTMAIDIEWPDIRDRCPVARALTRWLFDHHIHVTDISVNHESAEIVVDWHQPSVRYWHTAGGFIRMFDHCHDGEPATICFVREPV